MPSTRLIVRHGHTIDTAALDEAVRRFPWLLRCFHLYPERPVMPAMQDRIIMEYHHILRAREKAKANACPWKYEEVAEMRGWPR